MEANSLYYGRFQRPWASNCALDSRTALSRDIKSSTSCSTVWKIWWFSCALCCLISFIRKYSSSPHGPCVKDSGEHRALSDNRQPERRICSPHFYQREWLENWEGSHWPGKPGSLYKLICNWHPALDKGDPWTSRDLCKHPMQCCDGGSIKQNWAIELNKVQIILFKLARRAPFCIDPEDVGQKWCGFRAIIRILVRGRTYLTHFWWNYVVEVPANKDKCNVCAL